MADPEKRNPDHHVHCAGVAARKLRRLHELAAADGRGRAFVSAFRTIVEHLERDPMEFGEPLYRLAYLRLRVRTCAIAPLVVHFAVSEDMPVVYINNIKLLS